VSYDTLYFVFVALVWIVFAVLPWRGWVLLIASIVFIRLPASRRA
jgi:hypothetical protein